jgi:hypothetical protein
MDDSCFDALIRLIGVRLTRRTSLGLLPGLGALLGSVSLVLTDGEATAKRKRRKKTLCECTDTSLASCTTRTLKKKAANRTLASNRCAYAGACRAFNPCSLTSAPLPPPVVTCSNGNCIAQGPCPFGCICASLVGGGDLCIQPVGQGGNICCQEVGEGCVAVACNSHADCGDGVCVTDGCCGEATARCIPAANLCRQPPARCREACPEGQFRNPITCDCCNANGTLALCLDDVSLCCSGRCQIPNAPGESPVCVGVFFRQPCDFNEQCADGICSGTNGECVECTDDAHCQTPTSLCCRLAASANFGRCVGSEDVCTA